MCLAAPEPEKEIIALLEELSAIYPIQTLHEMYEGAVSDAPHSRWYTDRVAREKTRTFHVHFERHDIVEDVSPDELLAAAPHPDSEPESAQQL